MELMRDIRIFADKIILSHLFIALVIGGNVCGAEAAATSHDDNATEETPREQSDEINALMEEFNAGIKKKEYSSAITAAQKIIDILPNKPEAYYNLTCAQSLSGKTNDAIKSLRKAVDLGWDDAKILDSDPDLEKIRKKAEFTDLIKIVQERAKINRVEKTSSIGGVNVKTIEGAPAGGLPYRIYTNTTASEKLNRLIVWFHPSGGSMNEKIEALAPRFIEHGYALMIITKKDFAGWTLPDCGRVVKGNLADAEKIPGINAKKPILMGYSAGGQMALWLYSMAPKSIGGVMLAATYPVDPERMHTLAEKVATPVISMIKRAYRVHAGLDSRDKNSRNPFDEKELRLNCVGGANVPVVQPHLFFGNPVSC